MESFTVGTVQHTNSFGSPNEKYRNYFEPEHARDGPEPDRMRTIAVARGSVARRRDHERRNQFS